MDDDGSESEAEERAEGVVAAPVALSKSAMEAKMRADAIAKAWDEDEDQETDGQEPEPPAVGPEPPVACDALLTSSGCSETGPVVGLSLVAAR